MIEQLTKSQRKALEFCRRPCTAAQVALHLVTTDNMARKHLSRLMQFGLVCSNGKRPATYRAINGEQL